MEAPVAKLKAVTPAVTEEHLKEHRPGGSCQSITRPPSGQVHRREAKLAAVAQTHHRRAERWIVVCAKRVRLGVSVIQGSRVEG